MAPRTTDFVEWTDDALAVQIDPREPGWLLEVISAPDESDSLWYRCRAGRGGTFVVERGKDQPVLILTERSRQAMMRYIEEQYMDGVDPEYFCAYAAHLDE